MNQAASATIEASTEQVCTSTCITPVLSRETELTVIVAAVRGSDNGFRIELAE